MSLALAFHETGHALAMKAEGARGLHLVARDDHYEVVADPPVVDETAEQMFRCTVAGPLAELMHRERLDVPTAVERVEQFGLGAFEDCACADLDLEHLRVVPPQLTFAVHGMLVQAAREVAPVLTEGLARISPREIAALAHAIEVAKPGDRIALPI